MKKYIPYLAIAVALGVILFFVFHKESTGLFIVNNTGEDLVECVVYVDGIRYGYENVPSGATMVMDEIIKERVHYIFLVTRVSGTQMYDEFTLSTEGTDLVCDVIITPEDFAITQHVPRPGPEREPEP